MAEAGRHRFGRARLDRSIVPSLDELPVLGMNQLAKMPADQSGSWATQSLFEAGVRVGETALGIGLGDQIEGVFRDGVEAFFAFAQGSRRVYPPLIDFL